MKILFSQNRLQDLPIEEDFIRPNLQDSIEKTRHALDVAYAGFDNATDPDLIDCYIFEINALLKKYKYLSDLASKEKVSVTTLSPESPIHALVSHVFG
ncbi:MAG: YaaL family protein [Lachnospiraceae bacterium]|nr:YaaL family protein [Lachnospiraceae bacterium]